MKWMTLLLIGMGFGFELMAQTQCVAHRGNSSMELENSIRAIQSAADVGVSIVEFDVRHTADGIGIVMHDDTLERTAKHTTASSCPLETLISKVPYSAIKEGCLLKNGERVPKLSDVLDVVVANQLSILVEFKGAPSTHSVRLLKQYFDKNPTRLSVISFSEDELGDLLHSELKVLLQNGSKLLHVSSSEKEASLEFDGVTVRYPGESFVRRLQNRGKSVGVWTVNNPFAMQRYAKLAVDYLTTDYPQVCLAVIRH